MILVTVGTIHQPFPRLINFVINYFSDHNENAIIQSGNYKIKLKKNNRIKIFNFIEFKQLEKYIKQADTIICAGGEGTIIQILELTQNKPIIFPRLRRRHEHVDDQQLFIARSLEKKGLAKLAETHLELKRLLDSNSKDTNHSFIKNLKNREKLTRNLSTVTAKFD